MAVVTGTVNLNAGFTQVVTSGVPSSLSLPALVNQSYAYANGTGAGQCDLFYAKILALAAAATTLDLTSLTDLNGAAINFARVREILIINQAVTAAYTLTLGLGASNPWSTGPIQASSTIVIPPSVGQVTPFANNARFALGDPYTVGATSGWYIDGTHKTFKLDPGANTLNALIILLGCSATS